MQHGIEVEFQLKQCFNGKKYKQLNKFHKKMIDDMFGTINDELIIESDICKRNAKPDIYIKIGETIKYISIKSGEACEIHQEEIKSLIIFLRELGIKQKVLKTILLFQYGDGTIDGTGKVRLGYTELIYKMKPLIDEANIALNDKFIKRVLLERFLFKGRTGGERVDFLYIGECDYGVYASREDITYYILTRNKYNSLQTLHVGPFVIAPFLRDINRVSKNLYKRDIVRVKWYYILQDLEKVNKFKNYRK